MRLFILPVLLSIILLKCYCQPISEDSEDLTTIATETTEEPFVETTQMTDTIETTESLSQESTAPMEYALTGNEQLIEVYTGQINTKIEDLKDVQAEISKLPPGDAAIPGLQEKAADITEEIDDLQQKLNLIRSQG